VGSRRAAGSWRSETKGNALDETLIVGAAGFVGRAIQERIADRPAEFVLVTRPRAGVGTSPLRTLQLNLRDDSALAEVSRFRDAIWVAGNAEHGLGWSDPIADLDSQLLALLSFLKHFRGSLTLLSSQAVYFGLDGEIVEDVDHVPAMPYGFAKLAAERYARWALEAGRLRQLWVYRLMYAFGEDERPRRLLARCMEAARSGGRVTIAGGGRSFLNPLPVDFVADVLLRSAEHLRSEADGFVEITNINHPDRWTVLDTLATFNSLVAFDYDVVEAGEDWPVTFYGDVGRLTRRMNEWGLRFPDIRASLSDYRDQAVRGDI
jgi:nucleoside-diphosphate-sugar epimerase